MVFIAEKRPKIQPDNSLDALVATPGGARRPIGVPKTLLCAAAIVLALPTEDGSKLEGGGPILSPGSRTLAAVNCLF